MDGISTEKSFMVESLLKSCNFRQKLRYNVSVEELMSINGLVSHLRTSQSNKVSLRKVLTDVGVVPSQSTRLTSLCSKLTEDEAADLATDLEKLACNFIDFKMAAEARRSSGDKTTELSRTKAFREFLAQTKKALIPFMSWYDTVTHGLGPKAFGITVQIMDTYLNQVIQQLSEDLGS
ncbi:transcription factor AP-2-alpha-like isoform X1 [Astyanax mexicanus]|uniref:Transcription factor AP-2-alpha-like isoform X1 n=1 Tax=Astyanax mexicanus TaxID=7994 RepID=A0A8T2KUP0_ASTMX|nr:transcription factor AP-2-alpha-like isoform X1 [Astyanax mexicanus]